MMSNIGLRGDAARLERMGCSAFLTKPVKQSALLDCLMTVLDSEYEGHRHKRDQHIVTNYSENNNQFLQQKILLVER